MSVFLITSSIITTLLIPQAEFQQGGGANGRALAYLAHEYLGNGFGTVYDASTITILWFAGASAMAGLLNLVPRYLPRYGMAPEWAKAVRPLVLVFAAIAFLVTWIFDANVDAQSGAYATGVLVLMTSASLAVTLSARRRRKRGQVDRLRRHHGDLRLHHHRQHHRTAGRRADRVAVHPGDRRRLAGLPDRPLLRAADQPTSCWTPRRPASSPPTGGRDVQLIAHDPDAAGEQTLGFKERQQRAENHIPSEDPVIFLEVTLLDASDFTSELHVTGSTRNGRRVLEMTSPVVSNSIAALLLHLRDEYGVKPNVYFEWTEGNPVTNLLRFLFLGDGEIAPTTREVLRRAEPDRSLRPKVHVG